MLNKEFDKWQADYTAKIRRWVPYYDQHISALRDAVPDPLRPQSILDIGCGNGNVTASLIERFPKAQYVLLDASEDMINACQARFARPELDITYMQRYAETAGFFAGSFDYVAAGLFFHHLDQNGKQQLFQKIFNWLRPGGFFATADLHASKKMSGYKKEVLQAWENYAKQQGTPQEEWEDLMEHHKAFDFPDTFADQIEWLKKAGFSEVKITWVSGYWGSIVARKLVVGG